LGRYCDEDDWPQQKAGEESEKLGKGNAKPAEGLSTQTGIDTSFVSSHSTH
jgi:hypothetical protein